MPVNSPRVDDVRRIAAVRARWCVTMYGDAAAWLRGNHSGETADIQIRSARDALESRGAPKEVIEAITARLAEFAGAEIDGLDRRIRTVAVFASEEGAELFALTTSAPQWVGVSDRHLIGPLLAGALCLVPPAMVLALSENRVRLVDVTARPAEEIAVPGLPADLKSTIALDLTNDRDTLAHLRTSEDPKGRLREYSRAIDRAIQPVLRERTPVLVIAAAEPLGGIFRSTTSYAPLASSLIPGNHDEDTAERIAALAVPVAEQHSRDAVHAALTRMRELGDRDLVLTDLDRIATAAGEGTVDTLFIDLVSRAPGVDDALVYRIDQIVRDALGSGATIVPVDAAELSSGVAAATLRYASPTV